MTQYEILDILKESKEWLTTKEIAKLLNRKPDSISATLQRIKNIKGVEWKLGKRKGYTVAKFRYVEY